MLRSFLLVNFLATALVVILAGCSQTNTGTTDSAAETRQQTKVSTPAIPASGSQSTIYGIVTDSTCRLNHAGMRKTGSMGDSDSSCALKCVEAGSRFVLADPKDGKVYRLSDQEGAKPFAGKRVMVKGIVNEAAKSMQVNSYTQAP